MTIQLFNTLTRTKEQFKPLKKGAVTMYHCGPTVYDYAHIGNLRSFVTWDLLRRAFELYNYKVTQVMNITDVDDKTIKRSREENISLKKLTDKYTDFFLKDIETLNILRPHELPLATEHVPEMIALIEKLLEKKLAYKKDGSVYFKISAFKKYGELSNLKNVTTTEENHITRDEYGKEDAHDFALWKAWTPLDGDVFWETSLGKGRPGWHIECSAMSIKYLGNTFDIHTGGIDLIFPHHENEIAQSEGATGKPFVHYWLHNEFVLIDGKKMAKSDGNILTLADIKKKSLNPLSYRYWLLTAHYRTIVNFTWEALTGAERALTRLYEHYRALGRALGETDKEYVEEFKKHLGNDLDAPGALAVLWKLLKDENISPKDKKATLLFFDEFLGLKLSESDTVQEKIPQEVKNLVALREDARKQKNWGKADDIRKEIEQLGFTIKDTENGPKISKWKKG
ncbi:MAG: cysteine--tRNA ligase [bacterium]|nr:cysteine--tRNA ligase [bacterium]